MQNIEERKNHGHALTQFELPFGLRIERQGHASPDGGAPRGARFRQEAQRFANSRASTRAAS